MEKPSGIWSRQQQGPLPRWSPQSQCPRRGRACPPWQPLRGALRSSLHQEVVRIQFTIWKNTNHSGGNTDSHWGADLATWPDQHLARGQFSAKMEQNWRSGEKLWYNKTCANYFPCGLFYLKMAYIGPQCVSIDCPETWRSFQKLQIFVRACKSIAWISSVHWRQNHSVQKILVYPCNKLIYIVRIVPNLE